MSYQALARKWRPRNFGEVLGQAHVVSALTNALDSQRIHHAFLFTGTRGVGKTTLARIFARAINCETGVSANPCGKCNACDGVDRGNFIDLIEVDAASRTKVDDTRELLNNVQYAPTLGRYKIYLIDEVHMLSTHSFNALLKTLEEPPDHVKFLLATTDPQKLPATILSRCIQFNLKAMDIAQLNSQLSKILQSEQIDFEPPALMILSRSADGSVRDALSLLEQAIAFGNGSVSTAQVRVMLGMIDDHFTHQIVQQLCAVQGAELLQTVASMAERAVDYAAALDDILTTLHNVALYQVAPKALESKGADSDAIGALSSMMDAALVQLLYQICLIGKRDLGLAPDPRTGFEMVLLRMAAFQPLKTEPTLATTRAVKTASKAASSNTATTESAVASTDTAIAPEWQLEQLATAAGWAQYAAESGLGGITRELVMNMVPQSLQGETLYLLLDKNSQHLFNASRLQKIEQHCCKNLATPIKLVVEIDAVDAEQVATPSQQKRRHSEARQASAEESFNNDPNVVTLVNLFEAEVVPDSIEPSPANPDTR